MVIETLQAELVLTQTTLTKRVLNQLPRVEWSADKIRGAKVLGYIHGLALKDGEDYERFLLVQRESTCLLVSVMRETAERYKLIVVP